MTTEINSKQLQHQSSIAVAYLACPYAHKDPDVKLFRHRLVNHCVQSYLAQGKLVYSPLTHNIPVRDPKINHTWEMWAVFDKAMLSRCNELIVLQADGWKESIGVTAEIEFATSLELPIQYLMPNKNMLDFCEQHQ
ncbi:MAG: DUF1937 family protein [Gammaproteobacteria bacterium]|nr:DUF1937 family protein [Gammaproteobacteria bacterium]MCH9743309.1 DUF1937 family protein [Gammaproteobacteria bacterium]